MTISESLANSPKTFTLSIEPTGERCFVHPYHLGTIEMVARQIAEQTFLERNKNGKPTTTVALVWPDRSKVAYYDGDWSR